MQTIIIGEIEYQWAEGDRGLCLQKAIQVGATKVQNGKTYVFNENKRWTLKREPKAVKPAKAPAAPKQPKPKAAAKPLKAAKPANAPKAATVQPKVPRQQDRPAMAVASAKYSADKFLQQSSLGLVAGPPSAEALKRKFPGFSVIENDPDLDSGGLIGSRISNSDEQAKRMAQSIADRVNQLLSPPSDDGLSIGLKRFREGPPIANQEQFNIELGAILSSPDFIQSGSEINKLRRAMGGRLSRPDFDKFLFQAQASKLIQLYGGSLPSIDPAAMLDSVATSLSGFRTYIKFGPAADTLKQSQSATQLPTALPTPVQPAPKQLKPKATAKLKPMGPKAPTKKLMKLREQTAAMGAKVGADRLNELRQQSTSEEHLHGMLKQETGGVRKKRELKPKAMRSEVLSQPLTPRKPKATAPAVQPKVAPKQPTVTPPVKPPSSPKVTPRKGERRSLQPKTPAPQPPAPIVQQVESHPEIQVAAKRVGAIARAMESVKSMGENNPAIAKLKATAQANPGAVEDIAVAAIAMAGQFALMPQADLATAALMQGAIGVATRAGARTGKRVREELKQDPNTLKSLQGVIKLGRGILSDLMSQEAQEKMIGDAIGPTLAAGTGAAVGGGLAGAVAGTGAAVGGAPRAAAAIRQVAASKLQPKGAPKQLRSAAPRQLKPKMA